MFVLRQRFTAVIFDSLLSFKIELGLLTTCIARRVIAFAIGTFDIRLVFLLKFPQFGTRYSLRTSIAVVWTSTYHTFRGHVTG